MPEKGLPTPALMTMISGSQLGRLVIDYEDLEKKKNKLEVHPEEAVKKEFDQLMADYKEKIGIILLNIM